MFIRCFVVAVLTPLGAVPPAASALRAQSGSNGSGAAPVAHSVPTDTPPTIDGRLDDAAWASAPVISGFVQHEPFEGRTPTERTEVRILHDTEALYIGAWLLDSDPSGIIVGETRRDANMRDTDAILIVLDTYRDRQNGFVFGTTPAGIEYDGQVTQEGQGGITTSRRQQAGSGGGFNLNWDGSWEVATSVDGNGWFAEFRIPFSTLRYGRGGEQVWGMNISRTIRRRNEEDFWAPIPRIYPLYRVSQAGALQGVQAPMRRTVQVTPYALSSAQKGYQPVTDTDVAAEIGGDAKIGVTPSLTLDLTYNTDFAQVEADEQQINLTRFSLFFPEKRPFFLENAGTFSVGTPRAGTDLGMDVFFSRRIGIGEDGAPVPIIGGGRLTGKAGGLTLGFMDIQTDEVGPEGIPANNYAVGRLIRELPNRSRIGALVVSRLNTDETDDYNVTYTVDGRLGLGSSINLDGYASLSETPGLTGRERAGAFTASYQTREWDTSLQYREVGEDYNPEVGFLPRKGFRAVVARLQRQIRIPDVGWLRELRPHTTVRNFFDFDGFNETRFIHFDGLVVFANGAVLSPALNLTREGLRNSFDITDDIAIAPGTYDNVETRIRFNTNQSAAVSLTGEVTIGGFFSGDRRSFAGTLNFRSGTTVATGLRLGYDDVDLREGSFQATVVGWRLAYSFTPRIFLQSLLQFNNQSDQLSGNVRFGWLDTAGTGLFIVYNEVQQDIGTSGLEPQNRALVVKYTRQLNILR